MTEPVKLELTLQIDDHLARFHGYDLGGDEVVHPLTLEDLVITEAARALVQQAKGGKEPLYDTLATRVRAIRDEEIRKAVEPLVVEALTGPIQKTNTFGEGSGQTTTLREEILIEARTMLKVTSVRDDLRRQEATPLQKVIREQVEKTLGKELTVELDAAKAEVLAAVREKGSEVLAKTIASMSGVKL